MFKVIDKRDTHKTKRLLQECSKVGGLYVCRHPERIEEKCIAYGIIPVPKALSYEQFLKKPKTDKLVFIDELENFTKVYVENFGGYCQTTDED